MLFILALLTGFAIPSFLNPKMALAAHVTGILNALMLIVLGLAWHLLSMTRTQEKLTAGLFLFATYINWGSGCLAAAWGTSRLTPLSAAGHSAAPWKETLVQSLQISLAPAILLGAALVVYALRPDSGQRESAD